MSEARWKQTLLSSSATIGDAVGAIDAGGYQIALVIEDDGRFVGTITDGDIRRGLLKGFGMASPAVEVVNKNPRTVTSDAPRSTLLAVMHEHAVRQVPVVGADQRVAGLWHADEIDAFEKYPPNPVILMAGGLGKRLRPLTENTPKPLLTLGDKPLLESILEQFIRQGFRDYYISVNYLAKSIMDHFGDGAHWDVKINYLKEDEPLGTAGALRLLPERPDVPMIVMNGDLITRVNFDNLLNYHAEAGVMGTMCVREYDMEVPFGVVDIENNMIQSIDEKPVHRFFVNAGIYVVSPAALDLVPAKGRYDMTGLFNDLVAKGYNAAAFPIHEYWLDVGAIDDFERAKMDIKNGNIT